MPVAVFDLILTWRAKAFGLDGSWLYDTARFDKAMLDRMLGDLRQVLRGFGTQPEQRLSALGARAL